MYANYWYQSGISNTMKEHLKSIVEMAISKKKVHGDYGVKVLDIASNDGTLLSFYPKNYARFGVDPSDIASKVKQEDNLRIINDFFPSHTLDRHTFDIITSIAMFYDIEDPNSFVKEIAKKLNNNGIWCFEVAYLGSILDNLCYDTIVSEHLEHYHLAPLEQLLDRHNLKIVDVFKNDTNGGSIQCWATNKQCDDFNTREGSARLDAMRLDEFDRALDTDAPFKIFRNKVEIQKHELLKLLEKIKASGETIHLYGASTKANTLLGYCGIGPETIPYAAERSKEKFGAKTISGIKIISEEESRRLGPNYYLVGPWHFKKEILEREAKSRALGTMFIFPLPTIEVL
jgi:hypothetical protein